MSNSQHNRKRVLGQVSTVTEESQVLETLKQVNKLISKHPADTELLHARAFLYEKLQKWSEAINDYLQILTIDKNDKEAQTRTEMLKTILRYNNIDIYSSPNTNYDPWFE